MKSLSSAFVKSIAVTGVAAAALSGCTSGSDSTKNASKAVSKAGSSASSAMTSAAGGSSSAPSPSSSDSASSQPSASESSSSSGGSGSASMPDGTQEVKATENKISFAAPKDWVMVDSSNAKDPNVLKKLQKIAERQSVSPEKLTGAYTSMADVVVLDASGSQKFNDNINVLKMTHPSLMNEGQYRKEMSQTGNTKLVPKIGKYSKIDTPAGQGAELEYTLSVSGTEFHGVSMQIPNGEGSYSTLTVSASSADAASKYAKDIASSVHKI